MAIQQQSLRESGKGFVEGKGAGIDPERMVHVRFYTTRAGVLRRKLILGRASQTKTEVSKTGPRCFLVSFAYIRAKE